jgi:hypothetical protein
VNQLEYETALELRQSHLIGWDVRSERDRYRLVPVTSAFTGQVLARTIARSIANHLWADARMIAGWTPTPVQVELTELKLDQDGINYFAHVHHRITKPAPPIASTAPAPSTDAKRPNVNRKPRSERMREQSQKIQAQMRLDMMEYNEEIVRGRLDPESVPFEEYVREKFRERLAQDQEDED